MGAFTFFFPLPLRSASELLWGSAISNNPILSPSGLSSSACSVCRETRAWNCLEKKYWRSQHNLPYPENPGEHLCSFLTCGEPGVCPKAQPCAGVLPGISHLLSWSCPWPRVPPPRWCRAGPAWCRSPGCAGNCTDPRARCSNHPEMTQGSL